MALPVPKRLKGKTHKAHQRSPQQERQRARELGGKPTKASGAVAGHRGDVRVQGVLRLELKTTQRKSFSVTPELIQKIENAALPSGEIPALEVEFLDDKGKPTMSVCVVPTYILSMLMEIKNADSI